LDPIGRKEVMDVIASLAGKVTVFFSTHILQDVERICDRVIIIHEGKKLLEDSMENIKQLPDVRSLVIELEDIKDSEYFISLKTNDSIVDVTSEKQKIIISSHDINDLRKLINKIVHENNILFRKMYVEEVSLEDIFIKAVNHNA
jgi:ABC-2 type transport system ATP-binding protein